MQTETSFDQLVEQLSAWDGSWEQASLLRTQAKLHKPPQRPPRHPTEAALFLVCASYQQKKEISTARATSIAPQLAPFLGDREMGRWPFDEMERISDEDAIAWLPVIGRYALLTDALRQFVYTFFVARRREVWLPASLALAHMAARDEASREWLQAKAARAFPEGIPKQWSKGRIAAPAKDNDRAVHDARHVLHCACALAALGHARLLPSLLVEKLPAMSLPKDDADASLVLLALGALLQGESTRAVVLTNLSARIKELSKDDIADEMQEEALRSISDLLWQDNAAAALRSELESYLQRPRWRLKKGGKQLDALWSWLETAAWLQARGDTAAVEVMQNHAQEAKYPLQLRLKQVTEPRPIVAFVEHLRALYDEALFATTPPTERVSSIAALLLLLQEEPVASLPWRQLGARALGGEKAAHLAEGSAREVASVDLLSLLTSRKITPALLMRSRALPRQAVLTLASSQDGFVARQVAVQMERLLREADSGEVKVKLLWSLLQRNPPPETFRELGSILRGADTPLHRVVKSLSVLDQLRADSDQLRKERATNEKEIALLPKKLADEYRVNLASATAALLHESKDPSAALAQMAEALQRAGELTANPSQPNIGSPSWLAILRGVLLGEPPSHQGGIDEWMRWLGAPVEPLRQAWKSFEAAALALSHAEQLPTDALCDALQNETSILKAHLALLAWPESRIVGEAVELIERWIEERRVVVRENSRLAEMVSQWLHAGDEEKIEGFVDSLQGNAEATIERLSPELTRRLHAFLLHHLLFERARLLRAHVNPKKVQLSSVGAYLFPLMGGVGGGVFNALGGTWNEVILEGHRAAYWATALFSLVVAFALLSNDLSARMIDRDHGAIQRATRIARRVLPLFGATFVVALVMTTMTLWTLSGTASREIDGQAIPFVPQAFLWTCLSLFFGVFLGLVLQGRGATKEDS